MTDKHQPPATTDPERDPGLAHLLSEEYGATESALAARALSIITAVVRRSGEARPWWAAIASWSHALVPLGAVAATTVFLLLVRAPSATMTPSTGAYPDALGRVTVVGILATRATGQDVVAVLLPATADELLTAAVRP